MTNAASAANPLITANPAGQGLTDDHVMAWRNAGAVLVSGLLPVTVIDDLRARADSHFPAPGSDAAAATRGFGSSGALVFPADIAAFNTLTLHPALLTAVACLLDTTVSGLRLSQSDLWAKYGRATTGIDAYDNQDQRIHVDYPNHTLVHPAPWSRPEAVEIIVYLDDDDGGGGGTAVVLREGDDDPAYPWPIIDSPGIGRLDYHNDRGHAERYMADTKPEAVALRELLYERERRVAFRRGDVLLYRHDTWHRGTPLPPGTRRLVHNLTFRHAWAEWISTLHIGWAWALYRQNRVLPSLLANSSLDQRAVLGFPQPGSPYWSHETIAAVEARYGPFGMDLSPYRAALI